MCAALTWLAMRCKSEYSDYVASDRETRWWPSGEQLSSADVAQGGLRERCPDLFFLRWSERAYQHYATVSHGDQPCWRCPEAVCDNARRLIQALPTVQALQEGDGATVRAHLLALLRGEEIIPSGPPDDDMEAQVTRELMEWERSLYKRYGEFTILDEEWNEKRREIYGRLFMDKR